MHINSLLKKTFKTILRILPILFWILLLFGFDIPHIALSTILAALIHELSHIAAAMLLSGEFRFYSAVSGFRLRVGRNPSYKEELVIAAAGPIANFAVFAAAVLLFPKSEYALEFGIINLLTALSNLLPIEGYDGYRILTAATMQRGGGDGWLVFFRAVSFTLIAALTFLSLYFMKRLDGGYWIFFVFISILIKTIKKDEKRFFARKREKK